MGRSDKRPSADAPDETKRRKKLLDDLAKEHSIADRDALAFTVDGAMRIYNGRGPLSKADAEQLLASIPKVIEVLNRGDNEAVLASLVMDRDSLLINGGPYDASQNAKIIASIWHAKSVLPAIASALRKRSTGRTPNMKLHGAVDLLNRYALAKALRRRTRFVESVMWFIDPSADVASALRRRLKKAQAAKHPPKSPVF